MVNHIQKFIKKTLVIAGGIFILLFILSALLYKPAYAEVIGSYYEGFESGAGQYYIRSLDPDYASGYMYPIPTLGLAVTDNIELFLYSQNQTGTFPVEVYGINGSSTATHLVTASISLNSGASNHEFEDLVLGQNVDFSQYDYWAMAIEADDNQQIYFTFDTQNTAFWYEEAQSWRYLPVADYYSDPEDVSTYALTGHEFGWRANSGSGYTETQITENYPAQGAFVATTSYVYIKTFVTESDYDYYDNIKFRIECKPYQYDEPNWIFSYANLLTNDFIYKETVSWDNSGCTTGTECYPFGLDYPSWDLNPDSEYLCDAEILASKTWDFFYDTISGVNWTFFTFTSTTSPSWYEYASSSQNVLRDPNLTGTSTTQEVFASCSVFSTDFSIQDCLIAPIKFMFVPTQYQMDTIYETINDAIFTNFPFYYIGEIRDGFASSTRNATTTAYVFPDMEFETQDMGGATTTITIFDGSQFVSAWVGIDEFETMRDWIGYGFILTFVYLMFFRIRRIIPSSLNIKDV